MLKEPVQAAYVMSGEFSPENCALVWLFWMHPGLVLTCRKNWPAAEWQPQE